MTDVNVERNLIGQEDLLLGVGTVTQSRGGVQVPVKKINAAEFPYDSNNTLKQKIDSLDTTHYVDENGIPVYIATPHDTANLNLLDVIWIKDIGPTEKQVYYYDKLMFKYNPSVGNLILDPSLFATSTAAITAAYQAADTSVYNTLIGIINAIKLELETDDTNIIAAYKAADSALLASLALGTAASKDVGTSAGNVVQLGTGAKLPAVDGSQLLNLPPAVIGSGAAVKKQYFENSSTTVINNSGEHQMNGGASPSSSAGFSLFSQSYTPIAAGNKLIIKVVCPTIQYSYASPSIATIKPSMAIFINGTFVRAVVTLVNSALVLECQHTFADASSVNINVRIGCLSQDGGRYYINNASFGTANQGASLTLEEIKA